MQCRPGSGGCAWRIALGATILLALAGAVGVSAVQAAPGGNSTILASKTVDVDLDQSPEIISLLAEGQNLSVAVQQSPKGRPEMVWSNTFDGNPELEVRDLNRDKIPEIIVTYRKFDIQQVTVLAWRKRAYLLAKDSYKVIFNDSGVSVRLGDFNKDGMDEIEVTGISGANGSLSGNLIHLFDIVLYAWDGNSGGFIRAEERVEDRAAPADYPKLVAELEKAQDWQGVNDHFALLREKGADGNADAGLAGILEQLKVPVAVAYDKLGYFNESATMFKEIFGLGTSTQEAVSREKIQALPLPVLAVAGDVFLTTGYPVGAVAVLEPVAGVKATEDAEATSMVRLTLVKAYYELGNYQAVARSREFLQPDDYPEVGVLVAEALVKLGQRAEIVAYVGWLLKEFGSELSIKDRERLELIKTAYE